MTHKAIEALQHLINLHLSEQEGIDCGMPTADDWIKAVSEAAEALETLRQGIIPAGSPIYDVSESAGQGAGLPEISEVPPPAQA